MGDHLKRTQHTVAEWAAAGSIEAGPTSLPSTRLDAARSSNSTASCGGSVEPAAVEESGGAGRRVVRQKMGGEAGRETEGRGGGS